MPDPAPLPAPPAVARLSSQRLVDLIEQRIDAAGGWLDFAEFMELALYAPGLGYYSAGSAKFGAAGDFVTAPELTPLFARCLARAASAALASGSVDTIIELGAGTGALAADLLEALAKQGNLPARYCILEVSGDLRERQQALIATRGPELASRVCWLDTLPDEPVGALIIANEVVDALPVSIFVRRPRRVAALGVMRGPGGLRWREVEAADPIRNAVLELEAQLGRQLADGYRSELRLAAGALLASLAGQLARGLAIVIDYGLPRREYYHADRSAGSLLCHYRHRAHPDPFFYPGLQDISAWVDFTQIAEHAADAGLDVAGFTTQAQFLLANGLEAELGNIAAAAEPVRAKFSAAVRRLVMPGEMGEAFKVMTLAKALPADLLPASGRDLRHLL